MVMVMVSVTAGDSQSQAPWKCKEPLLLSKSKTSEVRWTLRWIGIVFDALLDHGDITQGIYDRM